MCGDVMLGRGIDQILPHRGDPVLEEGYVTDAGQYVALAESLNGPIARPVDFAWPWGESLQVLDDVAPEARIINLETSITRNSEFAPGKAVHYRMSPANVPTLSALHPSVCALANNHVLDFGRAGLDETLDTLTAAGLRAAGAGTDAQRARAPAAIPIQGGGRLLVLSCGLASSGIPPEWAASPTRSGVNLLPALTDAVAAELTAQLSGQKQPGDLVVVSVHWGSNWGYDVAPEQRRFAHALIDGGVDIVHGHSSHHARPVEIYRDKLVVYGCGDFVNDYEGISGYEGFRDDLRVMYFASLDPASGVLLYLRMAVMKTHRLSLRHASRSDVQWLQGVLDHVSREYSARVDLTSEGWLALRRS